jgi:hypothetical protein
MYLLNEFILFSPLIVYTYLRVLSLWGRGLIKILFSAGFVLLVAAFPVAEGLSHRGGAGKPKGRAGRPPGLLTNDRRFDRTSGN